MDREPLDSTRVTLSWEYPDGSGGHFDTDERTAQACALDFAGKAVRVWIGEAIVQRGWMASDEREG